MKVRLLRDIREGISFNSLGNVTDPGTLKAAIRRDRRVPMVKDAVVEMSEASAAKYIEAGVAEAYAEPAAE
jgi:hypothetical protein